MTVFAVYCWILFFDLLAWFGIIAGAQAIVHSI